MNPALCGLAANAALPSELLDRLVETADGDVAAELARRADLSRTQAVALAARVAGSGVPLAYAGTLGADDVDPVAQPDTALALLDAGRGRPEWARVLAADPLAGRRERLAACAGLPGDVVERLAADADIRVVAELALWATADVAGRLARHPHAEVRRAAAVNEATPPDLLAALIGGALPPAARCLVCDREQVPFVHDRQCPRPDCDLPPGASCDGSHESAVHAMRHAALQNPATPADVAAGFADHPSMHLRWALAARPDLPSQVYERLAVDTVPGIRADLAENPAIGEALIRVLAADRGHDVRRRLAHNPRVPLDVLTELAGTAKIGATLLPRIAAASPAEVTELARYPQPAVRMLPARRRDLPAGIRDALAADPDAKVVAAVASHPGLPEAQLRAMADRYGAHVVAGVAGNPDATASLLDDLARHEPPVRKALREIARHPRATAPALLACLADPRAGHVAAGHPALPPQVVTELLGHADWQVVRAAAANPSLPRAAMEGLLARP
nr:hypothetical protein OH826_31235 [Streptomyces sp. NBC_00899]